MSNQKPAARAFAPKIEAPPAPPAPREYPCAYTLVEGPPGQWTAVCLQGVTARSLEKLEPNGDAEPLYRASQRIQRGIELRTIGKMWSKP